MIKFYIRTACFGLFLGGIVGCSNSEIQVSDSQLFSLQSSIEGVYLSRAPQLDANGQGTFIQGDVNTVFFLDAGHRLLQSFSYTYGNTYHWYDFQLDEAKANLYVSACYPIVNDANPADFVWDVTSKSHTTADLLAAAPVSVQQGVTTQVPLRFVHLMHKLAVKLTADGSTVTEGELKDARVTVSQFYPQAKLNLLMGTVLGTAGTPTQLQMQGSEAAFILPPQPVGSIEVKIELGAQSKTFKLSDLQVASAPLTQLQSGQAFTLKIKVSKGSFTITGQGIDAWGNQGEANGEIVL